MADGRRPYRMMQLLTLLKSRNGRVVSYVEIAALVGRKYYGAKEATNYVQTLLFRALGRFPHLEIGVVRSVGLYWDI